MFLKVWNPDEDKMSARRKGRARSSLDKVSSVCAAAIGTAPESITE